MQMSLEGTLQSLVLAGSASESRHYISGFVGRHEVLLQPDHLKLVAPAEKLGLAKLDSLPLLSHLNAIVEAQQTSFEAKSIDLSLTPSCRK
jgi:hypothetical protein